MSVRPASVVGCLVVFFLAGCDASVRRSDASIDAGGDDASGIGDSAVDAEADDSALDGEVGGDASEDGGEFDTDPAGDAGVDAVSPDWGGDTSPPFYRELCQQVCAVTASVPCPDHRSDCAQMCEAAFALGMCVAEMRARDECKIAATSAAFFCMTPPGVTILKPGICTNETEAFQACVKRDGSSPD